MHGIKWLFQNQWLLLLNFCSWMSSACFTFSLGEQGNIQFLAMKVHSSLVYFIYYFFTHYFTNLQNLKHQMTVRYITFYNSKSTVILADKHSKLSYSFGNICKTKQYVILENDSILCLFLLSNINELSQANGYHYVNIPNTCLCYFVLSEAVFFH